WMTHLIDAAHMVMGSTYPNSAVAHGGNYVWKDGREHCDVFHAMLDYPEEYLFDWEMSLTNASGTHYTVHGTYGTLDLEACTYSGAGGQEGKQPEAGKLEAAPNRDHMANWLECMRTRERPTADIEYGLQHSVATIMAAEALHTGRRMKWDPKKRKMYAG
ncbi:MAG: hypothetical protein GY851_07435, partial [bacterium]|nr:hypothetical protein [bacterium]